MSIAVTMTRKIQPVTAGLRRDHVHKDWSSKTFHRQDAEIGIDPVRLVFFCCRACPGVLSFLYSVKGVTQSDSHGSSVKDRFMCTVPM